MKPFTFSILLLLWITKIFPQYGIIQNDNYRYGPCLNYLNILEYKYSFSDLKKDTLKYSATNNKLATFFIQNKNKLLNAKFFDQKGNLASSGSFKDGNGKLIVDYNKTHRYVYNFLNGKLNDTTFLLVNSLIKRLFIFKDNVVIKQEWTIFNRIVSNYDENGFAHDSTLVYGHPPRKLYLLFFTYYYDSYKGKLYQVNIYEHGNLKEQIFYQKNSSIKKKHTIKYRPKDYYRKPIKNCL